MQDVAALRELIEHLLEQWERYGGPGTELHQPLARRGRPFEGTDIARLAAVHGLVRHVHENAAAVTLLIDHNHINAAIPLVRQMYECALTAVWLIQSEDDHGVMALLAEHVRNRKTLQAEARKATSQTFRDGADEIADTGNESYLGSFDSLRNFQSLCLDLAPGGTDAYIYYRVLSTYSHASLGVTDLYYSTPSPDQPFEPRALPAARLPLDASALAFFAATSMVWGARAFTYTSRSREHRSILRAAARQLEVNAEIDLSDYYRKRHATKRKESAKPAP